MNAMNKVSQVRIGSPLIRGLVYAFIAMGLATLVTSFILMLTDQKEESLPSFAYIIHAGSLLIGGFVSGKRAKNKGWYHGGLLGVLYAVIIFIIAFLSFDQGIDLQSVKFLGTAFGSGVIGGILGVNASK
ncbi:TIGR04086 family membrane protein [Paenibacillus contaminans]|uniref:TIGR04086 family membrane protein n=1 Tax=Paenibacillus contaminans TaxID=450362 RepID=A0A329MPX7_9BACL|nr:TIGR04086 family membrane protein [Paenibacillus contaminans]RAV21945.1 TIGR04086 family membrane protein [Paenibacillus contaminans]